MHDYYLDNLFKIFKLTNPFSCLPGKRGLDKLLTGKRDTKNILNQIHMEKYSRMLFIM